MRALKNWLYLSYWRMIDALHAPLRLKKNRSLALHTIFPDFVGRVGALDHRPRILEIGSRNVTGAEPRKVFGFEHDYIGVDIQAGPNVDVVADAHRLSQAVEPGSVDAILSFSVLEHLVFPWKVALEINRVLKPGGLAFIATHPLWPAHELPADFWRFPVGGLVHLFGETTGFRVLRAAEGVPCKIYAIDAGGGIDGFVHCEVNAGVAILVEKIADYDPERLRWDADVTAAPEAAYPPPQGAK